MAERTERPSPDGAGTFTVGVFKDLDWARRGLEALLAKGFARESISVVAKAGPGATSLVEQLLGAPAHTRDVARVGPALVTGPLVAALDGTDAALGRLGIAGTMRRVGFQAHDGQIYETLTGRGGILVAVHSEPRASDAIAVLHSYGAGNAAIGAWTGRV